MLGRLRPGNGAEIDLPVETNLSLLNADSEQVYGETATRFVSSGRPSRRRNEPGVYLATEYEVDRYEFIRKSWSAHRHAT